MGCDRAEVSVQEKKAGLWPAESKVFRFADMAVRRNANGSESRDVGGGALVTGEPVRMHESIQAPGLAPNAAHRIAHTEFVCVREGVLEFTHDGQTDRAEAGDVIFVAKGTLHQVRNVGTGPATYFVVSVGGDA